VAGARGEELDVFRAEAEELLTQELGAKSQARMHEIVPGKHFVQIAQLGRSQAEDRIMLGAIAGDVIGSVQGGQRRTEGQFPEPLGGLPFMDKVGPSHGYQND
jgi:hypothetical protein